MFLLAFSASCGMISGFMSSETQPPQKEGAHREADIYDLLAWFEVNKKKLAFAAVILVVIGFAIATMRHFREQKQAKASAELLALKPTLTQQTNVPPPQPSAFLKLAEDYKGTDAAQRARILAATTLFSEGRFAEAEAEFKRFNQESPQSPWSAQAALGIAAALEAQNKPTEAQAAYQTVSTAYPNTAAADTAKMALARIFETSKQPEQSLRLYNELLAPRLGAQPGEVANEEASQRKEALLRAFPHLKTNAPISASATGATTVTPSLNLAPSAAATNSATAIPPATNQAVPK